MALNSPIVFFAILIFVITVPYVALVVLDRLGMFGGKPNKAEQRSKEPETQRTT
jgi:hypothetical protein